jgi:hypothetical protein
VRAAGADGGGLFAFPPPEAHFVTGGPTVTSLQVRWPSGAMQTVAPVALGQVLLVKEL